MRYVLIIVLLSQLSFLSVARSTESCSTVISNSFNSDPNLIHDIKDFLVNSDIKDVYQGTRPSWHQYNEIQQLILRLEKIKLTADQKVTLNNLVSKQSLELQVLVQKLEDMLLREQSPGLVNPVERFLDYNIALFRLLDRLNQAAGTSLIPLPSFKSIPSDRELIQDAEALVKKIEKEVEDNFQKISQFGFKSLEEFKDFAQKESEKSANLVKLTDSQLVVAMHRPESARFWIPLTGFQNQRITKTSKGSFYMDTKWLKDASGRDQAEANLTLSEISDYISKSARFKPNYAEARPDHNQQDFKPGNAASSYGSDLWIIKDHVLNRRATWTPKDSLSPGIMNFVEINNGFDDVFIPWKFRSLIIPYLTYDYIFQPYRINENFKMNLKRWQYGSSYMEVQIFGPLGLNDVKAFHFKQNPPDKALFELLKSKNIEVMDERSWPPKPYNGEESL